MAKITLLGAGSGFTQPLFTDILNIEGLSEGVIGLVDIDGARLNVNVRLMHRLLETMGKTGWRVEAGTDRRKVLPGTDYLISTIEVSGVPCVRADNDIPLKYGIDQCIGDTIGPGGIMKALRTLPALIEILDDAATLCPKAPVLNYTNPMSIITLGALRATSQPFVGLCHSVQGNSREIAEILSLPYDELVWQCGGINHMAWFTVLSWKGQDMMPALRDAAWDPEIIERFPIRSDLIRNLGYFSTESCGHFSEYVPYYRKRPDLIKLHCRKRYKGASSFYADNWPTWRKATDRARREMANGKREIPMTRSYEYAADIIEAHLLGRQRTIYASVMNTGLIPNLPQSGVVEVATLVDRRGFQPTHFGSLPEQCAALCRSNMAVFDLCVQGILSRDREAVLHSMMMDPLSAAVCSLTEIRAMGEELFVAEKRYIPEWCARPKATASAARCNAVTRFVGRADVSPLLPHQDLKSLAYPKASGLGMQPRLLSETLLTVNEKWECGLAALLYFRCHIKCQAAMKLRALLTYGDSVKLWVDGREEFFDPRGEKTNGRDTAMIPFKASKGRHEILVALESKDGKRKGIALRFERLDVTTRELARSTGPVHLPMIEGQQAASGIAAVSSMSARNVSG